ncbi:MULTISPECIES: TatD family hydrolase [unclassified Arenibacter]|jgi:TatD DNase family protein|uniref:TatD family hydrolase n=1 Tax=unclassified Arenibacter TaxID=2615047 RepID=UPI000E35435C|nr:MULTISPECIES: TatD family hydrolase [unclassified Arenibacter]MCM4162630.1 hydrolase TatD [Arenibacter sp. A80]RFT58201.1 TatD family deoxyribonuclease [Arenibacter sp. P308M17]
MILTDTHTHLYSEAFDEDRDLAIGKAMALGIKRFFIPAIDSSYTAAMLNLEKSYPENIFLMTGLHPTHVKEDYRKELDHVEEMLALRKFYAVGETGIDLYWDKTFLKEQRIAFKQQIQWAKKYVYPIVIHCREGFDEIFQILEEEKSDTLYGIFHCFTGTFEQAQKAISYNMKLGIGGVVTFKNGKIDAFLGKIDLKHVVLETDSPYLAPVPYRGKRNESAYLVNILEKMAQLYAMDKEEVAAITTANSREIFGI